VKRYPVFYPVFVACNFVLNSAAYNISQIPFTVIIRPLIIVALGAGVLTYAFRLIFKDWDQAGLVAVLCVGCFLYYIHITRQLARLPFAEGKGVQALIVLGLWGLLVTVVSNRRYWQRFSNPALLTNLLNVISLVVLLIPAYFIVQFVVNSSGTVEVLQEQRSVVEERPVYSGDGAMPDIYYIILDGYGRADVLEDIYAFDNTEFVRQLEQRGFYVAGQSRSNYMQTLLSLTSSLNMQYLNDWVTPLSNTQNRSPLTNLIADSMVRTMLEAQGYKMVVISSGFLETSIKNVDFYFDVYAGSPFSEFEGFLLSLTAAQIAVETFGWDVSWSGYAAHRARILYAFEILPEIINVDAVPKFVFAHILGPHPPFVFDAYGRPVQPEGFYRLMDGDSFLGTTQEYIGGYVGELAYINTLLLQSIDDILQNSETPPIIIIQADHGPGALLNFRSLEDSCCWERFSILNAYAFPGSGDQQLYETISPVNSFRVVFDTYFGTHLGLLEDRNYYSNWSTPYNLTDVTERVLLPCAVP